MGSFFSAFFVLGNFPFSVFTANLPPFPLAFFPPSPLPPEHAYIQITASNTLFLIHLPFSRSCISFEGRLTPPLLDSPSLATLFASSFFYLGDIFIVVFRISLYLSPLVF